MFFLFPGLISEIFAFPYQYRMDFLKHKPEYPFHIIHPSTEARGSGFQHERRVRGIDDMNDWIAVKFRQHAQDPSRTTTRSGFEGNEVASLNTDLAKLLRSVVRGGRPNHSVPSTTRKDSSQCENNEICSGHHGNGAMLNKEECGNSSTSSAEESFLR